MRILKGLSFSAAAVALLLCGAAQADHAARLPGRVASQDPAMPQGKTDAAVGVGVICDTSEQAEAYLRLRADGTDITPAMHRVNAAVRQPRACGIAAIAFIRHETLDSKTVNGKLVQIVRINVIAGYNGANWRPVNNTTQYAVIESKGIEI